MNGDLGRRLASLERSDPDGRERRRLTIDALMAIERGEADFADFYVPADDREAWEEMFRSS